jgi:hypothetical protein
LADPATHEIHSIGRCHPEMDSGAISGAGGVISTLGDIQILWNELFGNGWIRGASNLFSNRLTILDIVRGRIKSGNGLWYSQGLEVLCESPECIDPPLIYYAGETRCASTSNWLVRGESIVTTFYQSWSASPYFLLNESHVQLAQKQQEAFFFASASWPKGEDTRLLVQQMAKLAPPSPKTK